MPGLRSTASALLGWKQGYSAPQAAFYDRAMPQAAVVVATGRRQA